MFHYKEGWFFKRLQDGHVRIVKKREAKDGSPTVAEVVIDASSWASIVAAVCKRGESADTFEKALLFHQQTSE